MKSAEDLLIVVPARGNSKRLRRKNIKSLGGRSLLSWTLMAIHDAKLEARTIVSTEDENIAHIAVRLGAEVPFLRPSYLSEDHVKNVDVLGHLLAWLEHSEEYIPKWLMLLQPTSPFRGASTITAALNAISAQPEVNSVVAMTAIDMPSCAVFVADRAGLAHPVTEAGLKPIYLANGALYLTRTTAFRSERNFYTEPVVPLVMDPRRSVDIDTEADWDLAEALLSAGLPPETAETAGCARGIDITLRGCEGGDDGGLRDGTRK